MNVVIVNAGDWSCLCYRMVSEGAIWFLGCRRLYLFRVTRGLMAQSHHPKQLEPMSFSALMSVALWSDQ